MARIVLGGHEAKGLTAIQGRHILALLRWGPAEGSGARHMGNLPA